MFRSILKPAIRRANNNMLSNVIKIFSMALGISSAILIGSYIYQEYTYDTYQDSDRIFRISQTNYVDGVPILEDVSTSLVLPLTTTLKESIPNIESISRFAASSPQVKRSDAKVKVDAQYVDKEFFDLFSTKILSGDVGNFGDNLKEIVITKEFALSQFGTVNALGETLEIMTMNGWEPFTVSAIIGMPISNHTTKVNLLFPMQQNFQYNDFKDSWNYSFVDGFVKLKPGTQIPDFLKASGKVLSPFFTATNEWLSEKFPENEALSNVYLIPIKELHFSKYYGFGFDQSDKQYVDIMGYIGMILLLVASVNFMLISLSEVSGRFKEAGIRQVNGATRLQLFKSTMIESTMWSLVSFIFGILIALLFQPIFQQITGFGGFLTSGVFGTLFIALLFISLIAGWIANILPALKLASSNPTALIREMGGQKFRSKYISWMVVVQFAACLTFIMCAVVIKNQLIYIANMDLGFDKENIVVVSTYNKEGVSGGVIAERMRKATQDNPEVLDISSMTSAFQGYSISTIDVLGEDQEFYRYNVDEKWFEVMGVKLKTGRFFVAGQDSAKNSVIINEQMVKLLQLNDPIGAKIGEDMEIIGVVEDFNYQSVKSAINPIVLSYGDYLGDLLIKVKSENISNAIDDLKSDWGNIGITGDFNYQFLDDILQEKYKEFDQWNYSMTVAAGLGVILACLGLFGLAGIRVEQRLTEMGIRKIFGAHIGQITMLILKDIFKLIAVSIIICVPLTYYYLNNWLSEFAFHIELSWYHFVLTFAVGILIALATVANHSIKLVRVNPVIIIRRN